MKGVMRICGSEFGGIAFEFEPSFMGISAGITDSAEELRGIVGMAGCKGYSIYFLDHKDPCMKGSNAKPLDEYTREHLVEDV